MAIEVSAMDLYGVYKTLFFLIYNSVPFRVEDIGA